MNSVSAFRQPMARRDRQRGRPVRQRHPVRRVPQGRPAGEVGQRPGHEAVQPDRGQVPAGSNPDDGQIYYGVAKAEAFVQALYRAGKNPTRASLSAALTSMNDVNKFALPGVIQKTSKTDHFVISQVQLQRFNGNTAVWVAVGQAHRGSPTLALGSTARIPFSLRVTGGRGPGNRPLLRSEPVLLPVALHRRLTVRRGGGGRTARRSRRARSTRLPRRGRARSRTPAPARSGRGTSARRSARTRGSRG